MDYMSNVDTPRYYSEFRDSVLAGEIPVCEEIASEMHRIDMLIADPTIYYVPSAVEGFISFCEAEMTLTDGEDVVLLDTFKLWAEQLFGWYHYVDRQVYNGYEFVPKRRLVRLTKKQYLIVARGAAKSMYAAWVQAYMLIIDTHTTHQITTAPTMKQADEVLAPIRTALARQRGPLLRFLTLGGMVGKNNHVKPMLDSTKRGIEAHLTNSLLEVRPMSIGKLQGLRNAVSTLDEWLSVDTSEDVIGAVEQGASKLDDYMIVAMSSEGTIRNGVGDSIKMELASILKGDYMAQHVSIFYYKLDDVAEVAYPELWRKANPNIGITVSYEAYQADVERAEAAPAARNDILAKRFNLPMEGFTYYFTYDETLPHARQNFDGMECALGSDLSQGDDFNSFVFMFPLRGGAFGVDSLNFISERTYQNLPSAAKDKYDEFIAEGSLIVMEGSILDMPAVYSILAEYIEEHGYDVRTMGYDPYNAETFVKLYVTDYGDYGVIKVRQGSRTETVPLGEIKAIAHDRLLLFDESLFSYAMANTMVAYDTNGNRKIYKRRYEAKIDPVASLLDAYISYKAERESYG